MKYHFMSYLDVRFKEPGGEWIRARAMLDTGSQGNCINEIILGSPWLD
jgi:hypothetical protein